MKQWIWRLILPIVIAALSASGPVRAADVTLDDPGTYLIEVGSGRTMKLGRLDLAAWDEDRPTALSWRRRRA